MLRKASMGGHTGNYPAFLPADTFRITLKTSRGPKKTGADMEDTKGFMELSEPAQAGGRYKDTQFRKGAFRTA